VRGIARLWLKWLDADASAKGCSAYGLYLGAGPDTSLELRFAGHRRSLMLRGVAPFSTEVRLVHKREVLDRIGGHGPSRAAAGAGPCPGTFRRHPCCRRRQ
jgi:hypothetical protein